MSHNPGDRDKRLAILRARAPTANASKPNVIKRLFMRTPKMRSVSKTAARADAVRRWTATIAPPLSGTLKCFDLVWSLYSRVRGVKVLDVFLGNLEIFFCGVLFLVGWVGFG